MYKQVIFTGLSFFLKQHTKKHVIGTIKTKETIQLVPEIPLLYISVNNALFHYE